MPAEEEKPVHEIDHAVARRLFKEYVTAKKAAGQSTKGLSYGKMLAKLSAEAGRLKEKLGAHVEVKFQVKTIDGKVRLRALRDKSKEKGRTKALTPTPPGPKLAPPPIPGAKGSSAKPPPVAPPPIPPKLAPPQKPLDETDEELGTTDLHHDDLDEMDEVDEAEFATPEDDSIRSTLAALMEEENEPLPATALGNSSDLTASQKLSFATLGDIAKRMDELADRKQAPAREAKAAKDRKVLEGESSGEADIRAVAESIKKKMAPEAGAPSGEVEGESIPISLTDEDEVAAVGGFGTAAAVSLAEHKPIVGAEDEDEDEEAPTRAFRPGDLPADDVTAPQESGGFPVGILLLLIIVVAGGVGYVMYGEQLLGGSNVAIQAEDPTPGPAPAPPMDPGPVPDEPVPTAPVDDEGGEEPAAETGATEEPAGEEAPAEDKPKKKKGKRPGADDEGAKEAPPPDDGGEEAPAEGAPEDPAPADDGPKEVDCLLDPGAPGCKKAPAVVEEKDAAPELPAKLTQNQLRDGFQKVKADAKLCGKHHGVETGTKVSVKVSIQGSTGGITKATPQDEHAGTALGKCVAEALERASFPAFSSPAMGVTWTIRM